MLSFIFQCRNSRFSNLYTNMISWKGIASDNSSITQIEFSINPRKTGEKGEYYEQVE
jgi:hypothetical protein